MPPPLKKTGFVVQCTEARVRDAKGRPSGSQKQWRPLWICRWHLAAFTLVITAFVVGLLLLFLLSSKDHGIGLLTTNHYTWTYAPTAVLVLVVGVWRQIDFQVKSLKPWDVLARGNGEARKTVMLDYVSPLQITSFYDAIRNKHLHVSLSISGFFLLKLVALASTGLLLPVPTTSESVGPSLTKLASFSGALANFSISPTLNDTSLLYTAYGIATNGLSVPDGIKNGIVFEPFTHAGSQAGSNINITAEVNALIPKYLCESAPVDIIPQPQNTTDEHPEDTIQMLFPECAMPDNSTGRPAYVLNPQTFLCPPRQLSPVMQPIRCTDGSENWQLLTLSDFRYGQTVETDGSETFGDPLQASSWSTSLNRTTSIACRSTYSMHRINVTYDRSSEPPKISLGPPSPGEGTKLDGPSDSALGQLFTASLSAASDMFGNVLEGAYAEEYPQTMSKFMAALGDGTYESLLDEATMIKSAEKVFQAVAAQILHKYYMQNISEPLIGAIQSSEIRLHVSQLSLWIMVAGFSLAALVSVWLFIFPLQHTIPRDPKPMLTMGLVLAQSERARAVFRSGSLEEQTELLENYHYSTAATSTYSEEFELFVRGSRHVSPDLRIERELVWWKPLFIQRYIYLISLALPIACIAVLEVLQRFSDRDDGFASVKDADSLGLRSTTRYLPALILLLVATLINSIDFNLAVLAPYQALRDGWTKASGPMSEAILGRTPPDALMKLLQHRNWGPLLSAVGALLGSVLTILVSGLYVVESIPMSTDVIFRAVDAFHLDWENSAVVDMGAAVLTSLSESANLTYGPFTYEQLALPTLTLVTDATVTKFSANTTISVQVPALRAKLNCTELPTTNFNSTSRYSQITGPSAFIQASAPLPQNCQLGGPLANASTLDFTETFQFGFSHNTSLIGKFLDLHVGPFDEITMSSAGEVDANSQADNPPGCPSVALIYGYVDVNSEVESQTTVLVCYQQLEQTPTLVTLTYPDLLIPASRPPISGFGSVKQIEASGDGRLAFQFRPQLHLDRKLALFNQDVFDSSNSGRSPVDPFFQAVLFGRHPLSQAYLASDSALARQKVSEGVQGVYGRYMAQAISANMRRPLPVSSENLDADGARTFSATVTDPQGRLRVKQNNTSKLALQISLGTMFLCMALAVKITHMKEVLQYNPCCIAGVAALWAGSSFCENRGGEMSGGAVGMGMGMTKRGKKGESGPLKGWEFRLGWCEDENRRRGGRRWGIESRWVGKGKGEEGEGNG